MMNKLVIPLLVALQVISLPAWADDELSSFQLKGAWWQGTAAVTQNTTLVATFDSKASNNADFALGNPGAGGFGMDAAVRGKYGLATRVGEDGAHLHYLGGSNINPNRGTIRMLVRGNVWNDPTPRWLFETRGRNFIGIRRVKGGLSLVMRTGPFGKKSVSSLDLPIKDIATDQWHSIIASWDRSTGQAWIALNGKGVTGKVGFPQFPAEAQVFYIGGGHNAKYGEGLMLEGLELDELAVYNVPVSVLEATPVKLAEVDSTLLKRASRGARLSYDRISDLQRWGGWMSRHTWPTQIGSFAQGRRNVGPETAISNDKGRATPHVAAKMLYASEVLGDARYFDVARRSAEFLLAAQDKRGFWVSQYEMTVNGIEPLETSEQVKLQDEVQAHPIFFLAYIYRLTGEQKYLDALKRGGEFLLRSQNPNGSWSHHYNVSRGMGETRNKHPQGGELNDRTMNDSINVMLLMYHITKDRKYIQAIKRAGQWLIDAQLTGKVVGWADQYDKDNKPVWARNFEPPALSHRASGLASRALVEMYRLSGDKRYLQPVEAYASYMKTRFADNKMYRYYDLKSGRPVAAWMNKIYFLDDKDALSQYKSFPAGSQYSEFRSSEVAPDMLLRDAEAPLPKNLSPVLTRDMATKLLPKLRKDAFDALDTQHASGMWVEAKLSNFKGSLGQGFMVLSTQATSMLRFVEASRIALGEIPPVYRGDGILLRMAYPYGDWYDIDWDDSESIALLNCAALRVLHKACITAGPKNY